jgi:hypothetical protein
LKHDSARAVGEGIPQPDDRSCLVIAKFAVWPADVGSEGAETAEQFFGPLPVSDVRRS